MRANWGQIDSAVDDRLEPTLTLLGALLKREEVIEVRVAETTYRNGAATGKLIANGYFNDPLQLAAAATRWDGRADLYLVINPVRRDLLYAAENQLRCPPVWTATSRDVTRHSAFIVNLATHGDLIGYHQALELAEAIRTDLTDWLQLPPVVADSGRCISLIYPIDLENNAAITHWVKKALNTLADRYSDQYVTADAKAHDPALQVRLWGTLASQASKVYRPTSILHLPGRIEALANHALTGAATSQDQTAVAETEVAVSSETSPSAREDHLSLFVTGRCSRDGPAAWTPTGELHEAYVAFCAVIGLPPLSAAHFSRELAARFNLQLERRKVRGKVIRGIRGLRCALQPPNQQEIPNERT